MNCVVCDPVVCYDLYVKNKHTNAVNKFEYVFPAIRGLQAGREYYVSMCPLTLIPKVFLFDEEEISPELRAQRILNRSRVPEIASYLVDNKEDYVFSAITASIDGSVRFEALGDAGEASRLGALHVDMSSKFVINDGQHRRAAIEAAIQKEPSLANETIAVVFFIDRDLKRSQQMFADLNRHAVKPSKSLGLLYDHRNESSQVSRQVAITSEAFVGLVEMEKTTLAERSKKLFTLSAIHSGCGELLKALSDENSLSDADVNKQIEVCADYWNQVAKQLPEWTLVKQSKLSAGEVRRDYIHSHAIVLQALGIVGAQLLTERPESWLRDLTKLSQINWSRSNTKIWEGRAMLGGRVSKASNNVTLTANFIKTRLGLALGPEEQRVENNFRSANG